MVSEQTISAGLSTGSVIKYRVKQQPIDPTNGAAKFRFFGARMKVAAPFCEPYSLIITTTSSSSPRLLRPSFAHVQFSHFLCSLAALFRGNRDCALRLFDLFDRPIPRLPGGRPTLRPERYARYTHPVYARCREDRRRRGEMHPSYLLLFRRSFIPAFLLDNERQGYRKERRGIWLPKTSYRWRSQHPSRFWLGNRASKLDH